ncbi:MAG: hypothetical protein MR425_04720 [Lachnospiraceae bacterium]|nr:hypothetical protein [Lachnospiraceae bacterium]
MKKKIISAFLCVSMISAMMAGCGSNNATNNAAGNGDNAATSDDAGNDATADSDTEAAETNGDGSTVENTVYGDASAEDAFVVWGWNDDIRNLLLDHDDADGNNVEAPFQKKYPDLAKRIVFVNSGGSDYYQTKVDEILADESNELYPDLMGLEVDYVLKYVNGDYLTNVADCGIVADDYANQYQYNLDLGTVIGGDSSNPEDVKALFWQATPGCFQLRADFCEKYLGTTDANELNTMFSTWDGVLDAAKKVNEASNGKVKLFSGYDECFRVLANSRTSGWYGDDDKLTVDDKMTQYMELAKSLCDDDLTFETDQWSTDWYANMEGDGETSNAALAYCGCPWFTYWCLKDPWKENTILVSAPEQFFWGGTGLAATAGCSDKEMAGTIIKEFTCDTDFMVSINAANSDFVNNKEAIKEISAAGATCDYLYPAAGQDFMSFFLPLADNIKADVATAEDQDINSMWATQVKEYANGNKDMDTAVADFKAAVHDKFSYLSAE